VSRKTRRYWTRQVTEGFLGRLTPPGVTQNIAPTLILMGDWCALRVQRSLPLTLSIQGQRAIQPQALAGAEGFQAQALLLLL